MLRLDSDSELRALVLLMEDAQLSEWACDDQFPGTSKTAFATICDPLITAGDDAEKYLG